MKPLAVRLFCSGCGRGKSASAECQECGPTIWRTLDSPNHEKYPWKITAEDWIFLKVNRIVEPRP